MGMMPRNNLRVVILRILFKGVATKDVVIVQGKLSIDRDVGDTM